MQLWDSWILDSCNNENSSLPALPTPVLPPLLLTQGDHGGAGDRDQQGQWE